MSVVWNHVLGTGPWVARYRVTCLCVHAKSHDGYIRQAYRGAYLDWLSDEQAAHFLRHKLVERVPEAEQGAIDPAAPVEVDIDTEDGARIVHRGTEGVADDVNTDIVDECLADLDRKGVPLDSGAPTCRKALRDAGVSYSNQIICAAVKQRRARAALSGTAT